MKRHKLTHTRHDETMVLADDNTEGIGQLLGLRLPWLMIGLLAGILAAQISSSYHELLSEHITLAFFIPVVVYMSDAVGTQTETIFVRNLARGKVNFWLYLVKELAIGLLMGTIFGLTVGTFIFLWLENVALSLTIGLAMLASTTTAPVIALVAPALFSRGHTDPAVSAGPFTTVVQDLISLILYFSIAKLILFS